VSEDAPLRKTRRLQRELEILSAKLDEAEQTLAAIRAGEADALVVAATKGPRVYTLDGADRTYRLLVERMRDGALVLGRDGCVLYANQPFATVAKRPLETLVGQPFSAFVSADGRDAWERLLRDGAGDAEVALETPQGRRLAVRVALSAVDEDADTRCVVVTDLSAARRTAAELARARAVEAILSQSPQPMIVCDAEGRVTYANRAAEALCPAAAVGAPLAEALACDPPQALAPLFEAAMSGVREGPRRLRLRAGDEARDALVTIGRLEGESRVEGAIVTLLDLALHRAAEDALHEREARLSALAEAIPDVVWMSEPDVPRMVYLSAGFEALFGRPREEVYADVERWYDHVHPADRGAVRARFRSAVAAGAPYEAEYRVLAAGGAVRWLRDHGRPLPAKAGQPRRYAGVAVDITARKGMEEALRSSEELLRLAFEAGGLGTFDWSVAEGRVTWSHETERIFGLAPGTFGGRVEDWRARVHPADGDEAERIARSALASGHYAHEHRIVRPDGEVRWVASRARVLRDAAGRPSRMVGFHQDVTERRAREAALRDADRRKDEFLAVLAHELRNPLAPIRNALELIGELGRDDGELARVRDVIGRQVSHMARLLDDLLDVSRIARGAIEIRSETLALRDVVGAAVEATRPLLERGAHPFAQIIEPGLYVHGDRARLVQALVNLLSNAAKFTPQGGAIAVEAGRDGESAWVRVRDSGRGIPREEQQRIFDLFVQADAARDRAQGGLGIGLTLVRRILHLHGGTVSVESEGPGRGAAFTIRLPARERGAPVRARSDLAAPVAAPPRRILIVEDNRDAAETLALLLRREGHDVRVAFDGLDAVRAVDGFAPDAAFVDLGLPGLDGFEAARRLRAHPHAGGALLVALSGYGRDEDRRRAAEAGFDRHCTKPVDPAVVRALVAARGRGEGRTPPAAAGST